MQSPLNDSSRFLPFFGQLPPNFLWNGADTSPLPFPPYSQSTAFPFPYQVPTQIFNSPSILSMLAAQDRIGSNQPHLDLSGFHSSASLFGRMSADTKSIIPCNPVTPPLTPMVTLTPLAPEQTPATSLADSADSSLVGSTTTPVGQPTRVSSRNRRPPAFIEGQSACPLCGSLLRASELAEHYQKELESISNEQNQAVNSATAKKREMRVSSRIIEKKAHLLEQSRNNVLMRVRHNRKSRAMKAGVKQCQQPASPPSHSPSMSQTNEEPTASTSSAPTPHSSEGVLTATCPVCSKTMSCNSEQMTVHVENCLSRQSTDGSNQDCSESDEECDSYTWCGQTRVRATSFLDSNELAASGFNAVKQEEEDETPVVVDDDLTEQQFGESQYSEADIIPCTSEEPAEAKAQSALRKAVISLSAEKNGGQSSPSSQSKWTGDTFTEDTDLPLRCLICMDRYSKPLVSVQCWHVYCEECWLRTLGAKKLCPQCNMITSAADLRRIYL